jgi:serine protease Do
MFEDNFNRESKIFIRPAEHARICGSGRIEGRRAESGADRPRARRRSARRAFTVLVPVVCIGASSLFGFLGGYVASGARQAQAAAESEIPYQSASHILSAQAIRTAASEESAGSADMKPADIVSAAKGTVVEITTETVLGNSRMRQLVSTGAGSGVIVSADGHIVTNNHVIADARTVTVRLADGSDYAATVKGRDAKTDLAVLKIDAAGLTPAVFGDSSKLAVGDAAVVIGNPLGELGGTVTAGIISALDREITIDGETMSLLQTDAAVNPGNSGGGLFNLRGELVGVINAKSSGLGIEGIGFAIPVNIAKTIIADLIASGYVGGRISVGLTLVDIQSAQAAMMYRVNQLGLYIAKSSDGAFKSGDRIISANGVAIAGLSDFNAALAGLSVGDSVAITVSRGGKNVTATIVLSELRS